MIYNKLVRDKIPEIIKNSDERPITHIADDNEYEQALFIKLQEEVDEFLENTSVEEAADIFEVLRAICSLKKIDISQLELVRQQKAEKRGGFKERIILERTDKE